MTGKNKRKFVELQNNILNTLKSHSLTLNEISKKSNINWNSTSRQLILLKGNDLVQEIFTHKRLRIFQITDKGKKRIHEVK